MIRHARSVGCLGAVAGAVLLLAGCATPNSPGASGVPAKPGSLTTMTDSASVRASASVVGPTDSVPVEPVPITSSSPVVSRSLKILPEPPGTSVPDWPTLQAAVAAADAQLATAKSEGWWSGPVCSPDIELHRDNAGQDTLSDEQLRAECAANLAEFGASRDDYAALQALDASARTTELARVSTVLGLPPGQEPTVGQVTVVHGCEQGWITDPADCSGIPAG